MKSLTLASTVWLVMMFCVFVFSPPLHDMFFVFFQLACWALIAIGFCLLITTSVMAAKNKRYIAASLLCLTGLAGYYTIGFDLGRHVLFQLRKSHYEQLLAKANETGQVERDAGVTDLQAPGNHAFYWQRGILDNWVAVIFDPSHELAKINTETQPANLWSIFGGTYYRCQSMGDGWYICWFT